MKNKKIVAIGASVGEKKLAFLNRYFDEHGKVTLDVGTSKDEFKFYD